MMTTSLDSISSLQAERHISIVDGGAIYRIQVRDKYHSSIVLSFYTKGDFERFQNALSTIQPGQRVNLADEKGA